jgi:hypothetical protein
MSGNIFVIDLENKLTELNQTDYDSEDLFQHLLAEHPAMLGLAGGPDRKLLLVRREHPVPDSNNGSDRWSLDHLFLDRQGVPVLVEVKQASDTRARREVVAQMLDYAANGVAFWPIDRIIQAYRETAEKAGMEPDTNLAEFLDHSGAEPFWRAVEANLRSGRVRMLFVADRIPKELARIVEFLNEQMRPAEVLAIEVEHFVSDTGMRTLVPKLVGQTERAQSTKAVAEPSERISESDWFDGVENKHGVEAREGAERAVAWLRANGFDVGLTASQDSLAAKLIRLNGKPTWPFFLRSSSGRLETAFQNLAYSAFYREEETRKHLLNRLRAIGSKTFKATEKLNGWPSFAMTELMSDTLWENLVPILEEIRLNIRNDA